MARIKIIDDDVEHAENLALVLTVEGHDVTALDDTEGAIELLISDTPDLVILDVMFPEDDTAGFDLARKIRQIPAIRRLPIILLTGINQEFSTHFSDNDIDKHWMPVQTFMEKPVDIKRLLKKVDMLLQTPAA